MIDRKSISLMHVDGMFAEADLAKVAMELLEINNALRAFSPMGVAESKVEDKDVLRKIRKSLQIAEKRSIEILLDTARYVK